MSLFFAQMPLVVSYYTKGTPYEEEVLHLEESCRKFGLEVYVEGLENRGSWEENCAIKPYFMKKMMEKHNRPLLWVDSDAVFLKPMTFEEFMFSDLSVFTYPENTEIHFRLGAGTIYVNATDGGRESLDLWCQQSDRIRESLSEMPAFADQISLHLVLLNKPTFSIGSLPISYSKIFDRQADLLEEEIVIEHRQASRRFKETVNSYICS